MTDEKVIQLLKIEHQCSQANCDRNCAECKLVQKQETLDEMYTRAVEIIKENKQLKEQIEKMKCCTNCKHHNFSYMPYCCNKNNIAIHSWNLCDKWELAE